MPGWHCVGLKTELHRDGAYFTRELFGYPLIVHRSGERISTFLNVCPHRFSTLSERRCGVTRRLTCPYHGWEFDEHGDTCRIPDAQSFRPLAKGQLGLQAFPTETCGQLVFVNLSPQCESLESYVGTSFHRLCRAWFDPEQWSLAFTYHRPNASNWKVSLENSLEGYHNATVHAATYQGWPDASACTHELHDRYRSTFQVDATSEDDKFITRLGKFAYRLAGSEPEFDFHEIHRYPNLVFAKFSKFTWAEIVIPLSPTDSYDAWYIFVRTGRKQGIRARALTVAMRIWFRRFFLRILREDERMFPLVQAGLESPQLPGRGLISVREERIHHFQQYLIDELGGDELDA